MNADLFTVILVAIVLLCGQILQGSAKDVIKAFQERDTFERHVCSWENDEATKDALNSMRYSAARVIKRLIIRLYFFCLSLQILHYSDSKFRLVID